MTVYRIKGINPTPWLPPKLGLGRRKGGGMYPTSYPQDEMVIYQNAIKEYMSDEYHLVEGEPPHSGELVVRFWYARSLNFGGQRRNRCDVTNLNKSLEDALQGILYANDRDNRVVLGVMVAQEKDIVPHIAIEVVPYIVPPTAPFVVEAISAQV